MIYRGVDIDGKGKVGAYEFSTFLKDVMRTLFFIFIGLDS